MLKKMKILVAAAALSGTVSANVQAATVTVQPGDTLWSLANEHKTSIENLETINHLTSDQIHPGDVLTISKVKQQTDKKDYTLWGKAIVNNVGVLPVENWNKVVTAFIHPEAFKTFHADHVKKMTVSTIVTPIPVVAVAANPTLKINPTPLVKKTGAETNVSTIQSPPAKPAVSQTATNTAPAETAPKANAQSQASPSDEHSQPNSDNSQEQSNDETSNNQSSTSDSDAKVITVKATAYTASCEGCSGITATGVNIKENPDARVIAVDPSIIPLGSKVYVEGFGEATAADTGGAIKGHRIDIFIPSERGARNFGVKNLKVTILN